MDPVTDRQRLVRIAARALGRHGLVHAYGHCSQRLDTGSFLVCSPRPMGLVAAGENGIVVPVDGELPVGTLGEVRIHQAIYRSRPDVGGVARIMPPITVALSVLRITARPWHGFASYFAPCPPLWDDPLLARDTVRAEGIAETLGEAPAVVMRGNGAVTVGASLQDAVVFAWYLEEAGRIERFVLDLHGLGDPSLLTSHEIEHRAVRAGGIFERMWEYLTVGDPEGPYPYEGPGA
ncbi:class II aldolase/adducin family protein [Magnetospirillum sp. 15-1]|uniref:class II aldolase/adducin family protein n=1 Tax=Magnetospirillum sp. 15-1 TaxID=1979370 RepID=UPI001F5B71C5|nr:class II aldolase/adducin family protein [Magnetospirillum sp. 15-1]